MRFLNKTCPKVVPKLNKLAQNYSIRLFTLEVAIAYLGKSVNVSSPVVELPEQNGSRVEHIDATITQTSQRVGFPETFREHMRNYLNARRDDEAFHLVAATLGGPPQLYNLILLGPASIGKTWAFCGFNLETFNFFYI